MVDPMAIEMIDNNLFESWRLLASAPGVEVYDGPDMLRFASGVQHPLCNGIMGVNLAPDRVKRETAGALRVFRERGLPMFCWVTPTTKPRELTSILEAEGLVKVEEATGMSIELSSLPARTDIPEGLQIQAISDARGLSSWMQVFCEVFDLPRAAGEFLSAAIFHAGLGIGSPFRHYLVSLDGSPVACSTTFRSGVVVGLYNVGTVPSVRGRGIGTISSLVPLKEAERAGCKKAVLQATGMGRPVYGRLGFEENSTLSAHLLTP